MPEIHPKERNNRISSMLRQLPRRDGVLLDQVLFVALERSPSLKRAESPLAYLQSMLADPVTRQELLADVDAKLAGQVA